MKAKLCFAVAVIFCMTAADAYGDLFSATARGRWTGAGGSNNTGTASTRQYDAFNTTVSGSNTRPYFVFNRTDWAGSHVVSGVLRLSTGSGTGGPISIFDFTGDQNALQNNTTGGAAIWADLGSGTVYGTGTAGGAQTAITLNAAAINALRSAFTGNFVVGAALTNNNTTAFFGTSGAGFTTQLDLVLQANSAPTSVTGGPYVIDAFTDLMLDGSDSFDVDESVGDSIINWEWDVNGDDVYDFIGESLTATWANLLAVGVMPGNTYTLQLRTTDEMGATNVAQTSFTVNAVPEPATCLIFALAGGSCGLVTLRRRRKAQAAA